VVAAVLRRADWLVAAVLATENRAPSSRMPPAEPVAAIGSPGRLHRDTGLAQDRDVAARGPFGHLQLRRELAGGDAGLGLQQLQESTVRRR
jgi:hypothetical protein